MSDPRGFSASMRCSTPIFVVVVSAACRAVLGIDEPIREGDAGGGGSGAASSTGGSGDAAATGGSSGDAAATGGSSGDAAGAPLGGSAGNAGSGGAVGSGVNTGSSGSAGSNGNVGSGGSASSNGGAGLGGTTGVSGSAGVAGSGTTLAGDAGFDDAGADSLCDDAAGSGPGMVNVSGASCGTTPLCAAGDCCTRALVPGGRFLLGGTIEARVDDFYLDRYEVSVGRFRQYVSSYPGPPAAGAGAHPRHGSASGWQNVWNGLVPSDDPETQWTARLSSCYQPLNWSVEAGNNETLPINCVTWFEAFAFCIWDGGRLPTEAEWEYAAGGGCGARTYPWGPGAPSSSLAVYGGAGDFLPVDAKPAGAGRFGHEMLAGSVREWTFDFHAEAYPFAVCENCVNLVGSQMRTNRGGGLISEPLDLRAILREPEFPNASSTDNGFRCAADVP